MHDEVPTSFPAPGAPRRFRSVPVLLAGAGVSGFFLAGLGVAFARADSTRPARLLAAPAAVTPGQATTPATPDPNAPNNGGGKGWLGRQKVLREPFGRTHFCGDYTAQPGTPGAVGSGYHVAMAVRALLG